MDNVTSLAQGIMSSLEDGIHIDSLLSLSITEKVLAEVLATSPSLRPASLCVLPSLSRASPSLLAAARCQGEVASRSTAATSMEREAGERAGDVEEVVEEEELSPSSPPPQSVTPLKQA